MKADPKQAHVSLTWKHGSPLVACAFDPKGRYVVSSGQDYTLQRWDLPSGTKIQWEAHDSWVRDFAFTPDGETFISCGSDDKIIFWPTAAKEMKPIRTIEAHKGWIRAIDMAKDGKTFVTGANDNLVKLWNTENGELIREFKGHELDVYSVLLHPDGKHILSGDQGGTIIQWEIATGKNLRTFDAKPLLTNNTQGVRYGGVRGLAVSPDNKTLACCGLHKASNPLGAVQEPIAILFDWESGKKTRTHTADGLRAIGWQIRWLNDGTLLCGAGGSAGSFLVFWRPDADKEYHRFKVADNARDMDLHPDSIQVATPHYDGNLRISKLMPNPNPPKKDAKKK